MIAPRKIDKSHGFMQSIIKNQVLRDEYDKETKQENHSQSRDREIYTKPERRDLNDERLSVGANTSTTNEESKSKSKRVAKQLYVPPHMKKRSSKDLKTHMQSSTQESPKPGQKRVKRCSSVKNEPSRTLFKFEYENDEGVVRSLVVKEDDNAEDLAETFGNQLGLTKAFRKALQIRLQEEMDNFM